MIFGTLAWTIELYMTKYIIGEIFSSGGATLYKKPSDQTVTEEPRTNWVMQQPGFLDYFRFFFKFTKFCIKNMIYRFLTYYNFYNAMAPSSDDKSVCMDTH